MSLLEDDGEYLGHLLRAFLRHLEPLAQSHGAAFDGVVAGVATDIGLPPRAYETVETYAISEPAMAMVGRAFARLVGLLRLTRGGEPVMIDGFRPRRLASWAKYPSTVMNAVGPISSYCDMRCRFCYEQESGLPYGARLLSVAEAEFRIAHYDRARRRALPAASSFSMEALCNPDAIEILRRVREADPRETLTITTHGADLTDARIAELARLAPVLLVVSLNSATEAGRRALMGDRRPEVAIAALPKLRDVGIPFVGSVVPWPTLPLDDVEATLRYLDAAGAMQIRVSLPGYTSRFPEESRFDTGAVWPAIVERVLRLRPSLAAPVNMTPTAYWNHEHRAVIEGVVPNSPAALARLKVGDRIETVNGDPVVTRAQGKALLKRTVAEGRDAVLGIDRGGTGVTVVLSDHPGPGIGYPYRPPSYPPQGGPFGLFLPDGFKLSWVDQLVKLLERRRPRAPILFVSSLMRPLFERVAALHPAYADAAERANLRLATAECRHWGGNIMLGDLTTVSDYAAALQDLGARPDLVLMPGSFLSMHGLDLLGHSYRELERRFRVPIDLIRCEPIME